MSDNPAPQVLRVKRETFEDIKAALVRQNPEDTSWQMLGGEISLNGFAIEAEPATSPSELNALAILANGILALRHAFHKIGFQSPESIILGSLFDERNLYSLGCNAMSRGADISYVNVNIPGRFVELCGTKLKPFIQGSYIDTRGINYALTEMVNHIEEVKARKDTAPTLELVETLMEVGAQALTQLSALHELVVKHNREEDQRVRAYTQGQ